jgi:anhydro-N-acetylmuramic acid kinase
MSKYFIGLMTGTSADSIDGCVVDFSNGFELICSKSNDLEKNYKAKYEEAIKKGFKNRNDDEIVLKLEDSLNKSSVELIKDLLEEIDTSSVSGIAFPGQTMFHDAARSYQIGCAQFVADEVGIRVIHDFRNYDMQKGGLGAPLVPEFHKYLFAESNKRKIIFNIGGISNGTYLDGKDIGLASDVGPGNCLIDLVAMRDFGIPYDEYGKIAASGQIDQQLLNSLYEKIRTKGYPRADDKSFYYNLDELKSDKPENLLATLSELTALCISDFCHSFDMPGEILLHGGGTKNNYVMERLEKNIGTSLRLTDHLIPSKFVESAAFAYLACLKRGFLVDPRR